MVNWGPFASPLPGPFVVYKKPDFFPRPPHLLPKHFSLNLQHVAYWEYVQVYLYLLLLADLSRVSHKSVISLAFIEKEGFLPQKGFLWQKAALSSKCSLGIENKREGLTLSDKNPFPPSSSHFGLLRCPCFTN